MASLAWLIFGKGIWTLFLLIKDSRLCYCATSLQGSLALGFQVSDFKKNIYCSNSHKVMCFESYAEKKVQN